MLKRIDLSIIRCAQASLFRMNNQLQFSSKNKIELLARILEDHRNANTLNGYRIPSDAEIRH